MKPCEIFHNVLLPPRKRLLAGLKRQNSEGSASPEAESSSSTPWIEYSARLHNLLKSGPHHMSPEEIAKAARSAAAAAAKSAHAARAAAEEKAAVAAKAVAAAKDAMSLVSCFSDIRDRQLRKKKKHVQVHKKPRIALPATAKDAMLVCGVVNEAQVIDSHQSSYTHKASSFCSLKDDLKESSSSYNTHICPLRDGIASISR